MAAELKGKISLDTAAFHRGLRSVRQGLGDYGKTLGTAFKRVGVAAAAASAAIVAGLTVATMKVARYGDEIAKTARATGMSTEELSGIRHAAEQAGMGWEDLRTAMAGAFQNAPGRSLASLADELTGITDPAKRAERAMEIFGKRMALRVLPFLSQGAEGIRVLQERADHLGLVVTPEQAAASEKFNDALDDLKKSVFGLAQAFVGLDGSASVVLRLTEAVVRFRKSATFAAINQNIANLANQTLDMAARIIQTWGGLDEATRRTLLSMGAAIAGFGAVWHLGLVQPIVKGVATAALATSLGFKSILVGLTGLGAFVLGWKIGTALERALNLSGLLMKIGAWARAMVSVWRDGFMSLIMMAIEAGKQVASALAGDGVDLTNMRAIFNNAGNIIDRAGARMREEIAAINAVADEPIGLGEAFADEFSAEALKRDISNALAGLADLVPAPARAAMDALLKQWREMEGVRFNPLPDGAKGLKDAADAAGDLANNIKEAVRGSAPLRGIFRMTGTGTGLEGKGPRALGERTLPSLNMRGVSRGFAVPRAPAGAPNATDPKLTGLLSDIANSSGATKDTLLGLVGKQVNLTSW